MNFSIIMHDSLFIIYAGNYFYIRPSNLSRTGKNCPLNLKLPLTMVVQSHIFQRSAFWQEAEAVLFKHFHFLPKSRPLENVQPRGSFRFFWQFLPVLDKFDGLTQKELPAQILNKEACMLMEKFLLDQFHINLHLMNSNRRFYVMG